MTASPSRGTGTGRWSTTTNGGPTNPGSASTGSTVIAVPTGCDGWRPIRWATTLPTPTAGSSPDYAPVTGRCSCRSEKGDPGRPDLPRRRESVLAHPPQTAEHLLGLVHDLGDQTGRRHQGLDGANPLAGGVALALRVDVRGIVPASEVEGTVVHRAGQLGGEGAELGGVFIEEGGVLVADDPHGLPREGAADGRPVLSGPYQRVLVSRHPP